MEIVGDEIPLTTGEVYAIVRRCRDERYAKAAPRFGLHSRSVPIVPQSSAHFQARSLKGSTGGGVGGSRSATKAAAALASGPSAAGASPSSSSDSGAELAIHASVGYEEILLLAYLRPNGGMAFGPSSCYAASAARADPRFAERLAQAPPPGTVGFARIVDAQLRLWDAAGQEHERQLVSKLRLLFAAAAMPSPPTWSEMRQLLAIRPTAAAHLYAVLGEKLDAVGTAAAPATSASVMVTTHASAFPGEPPSTGKAEEATEALVRAVAQLFRPQGDYAAAGTHAIQTAAPVVDGVAQPLT